MSGKNRKTGNLVALGSAAVVAVYGAGFMRTAEAAERFAAQSDERRIGAEDVAPGVTVVGNGSPVQSAGNVTATVASPSTSAVPSGAPANTRATDGASVAVNKVDATTAKTAEVNAPSRNNAATPMPPEVTTVMSASAVTATAAPAADPKAAEAKAEPKVETKVATEKVVAAPPAPAPVAAPVVNPATAAINPATSAKALAEAQAAGPIATVNASATNGGSTSGTVLKTGEYTGYGTSRHGDVEVYVETTDGKITYVKISQCLTQYSCSWIEDLPKQVLARQSTKIDAVSGATQSANAFYYALVAALNKAK